MAGSIEKRGERKWMVRMFLGRDAEGHPLRHNHLVNGTKKDAERYLTGVLRDRDLGRFAEPAKQTLAEFLDKWLPTMAPPRLKTRTYSDYCEIVRLRIKPAIGRTPLTKLTPMAISSYYAELSVSGLAPQTVRNVHTVLRGALKQAARWGMLPANPAADVDLPRLRKKEQQPVDASLAEKFIRAALTIPRGLLYLVALAGGMRPAEYMALRWPDLDLSTGLARIQRVLNRPRKGGGYVFEDPKTAKSRRAIMLPHSLLPFLLEHRRRQLEHRLQLGELYKNQDLVFATDLGEPLDGCNLNKTVFKKILAAAELPLTLRPYDMRHAMATLLLEAEVNPKIVSERLGHASTVMTLDVYSHSIPSMQASAARTLDDLVFRKALGDTTPAGESRSSELA